MYDDYKCVKCGTIEAVEDKVGTPDGNVCLDCSVLKEVGKCDE